MSERNWSEIIGAKSRIKRKESIRRGKSRRRRRRGGVKSSELDKETCGVLVKGTRVSGVRQSAVERLPK